MLQPKTDAFLLLHPCIFSYTKSVWWALMSTVQAQRCCNGDTVTNLLSPLVEGGGECKAMPNILGMSGIKWVFSSQLQILWYTGANFMLPAATVVWIGKQVKKLLFARTLPKGNSTVVGKCGAETLPWLSRYHQGLNVKKKGLQVINMQTNVNHYRMQIHCIDRMQVRHRSAYGYIDGSEARKRCMLGWESFPEGRKWES